MLAISAVFLNYLLYAKYSLDGLVVNYLKNIYGPENHYIKRDQVVNTCEILV